MAGSSEFLGLLPYALALNPPQLPPGSPPLALLVAINVVQSLVLIAAATAVGLWLGPRVGLGAPLLASWLVGDKDAPHQFRASIVPSAVVGALAAVVVFLLDVSVFAPRLPRDRGADRAAAVELWQALLASLYGGITEEILLRLGLMTVMRSILLNGVAGVVFGWLYWRGGLLAAMVAHFSADLVLQVLAPAILGRT